MKRVVRMFYGVCVLPLLAGIYMRTYESRNETGFVGDAAFILPWSLVLGFSLMFSFVGVFLMYRSHDRPTVRIPLFIITIIAAWPVITLILSVVQ